MCLELCNVSHTYAQARRPALNQLTIRIPLGKKCVLLGHNGSGKSTLFLHANGILRPDHGEVKYQGKPVRYDRSNLQSLRQKVGVVFQDPDQQLVANTVFEDVSYGLCNLGLPDDEILKRVEQVLHHMQMEEIAHSPIHHLSLGQKKQVALAGVLVLHPEVLLLDEPTAYLDKLHTRLLLEQLDSIHQSGTSVVMATHDLEVAYEWADWIFVMHQGELVLEGEPEQVFAQRERMEELRLGIPMLFELWETWQQEVGIQENMEKEKAPRTVAEFRARIAKNKLVGINM